MTNTKCMIARPEIFHTYPAEWTTRSITVRYDGKVCLVNRGSSALPLVNPALSKTPFPATMTFDHVRVWK